MDKLQNILNILTKLFVKNEKYEINLPFDINCYSEKEQAYLQNRLLDQIRWYDKKANFNQKCYKRCSITAFIISALIPVFTLLGECLFIKLLIAISSAIASIINYIINISTYKDLWIQYRMNCEMLKSEVSKFANKIPPYNSDTAFELLVENCEQYFTKEFSKWQNNTNQSSTDS